MDRHTKALSGHFTIKEAAAYTNLSVSSLRRYVKDGILKAFKIRGWTYRFKKEDLDALEAPVVIVSAGRPKDDGSIRRGSGILLPV